MQRNMVLTADDDVDAFMVLMAKLVMMLMISAVGHCVKQITTRAGGQRRAASSQRQRKVR